jgi:hypothetical protein
MPKYKYVGPPNLFYMNLGISPKPGDIVELSDMDHPSFIKQSEPAVKSDPKQEDTDGVRN